ncbi:MAG TPA: double-strand break repair protein AddB [Acetobacteraceae bacterium]|nr:double-strand break repair protein AddB [Acetobacteraceae bacterium]
MNLFALPPESPFLDSVAEAWLTTRGADPVGAADGLILLPTRRAARALAEAFLRRTDGRPLLLPRIAAFGALDEAPLALAGALDLPPAVGEAERLAVLARLILAAGGVGAAAGRADRAWALAAELARLQDEAERSEIDLAARLPDVVPAEFASHWQTTLAFLSIVTEAWPAWLAEQGLMNPAARQVALLKAQARAWEDRPPPQPIWVAGSFGEFPAVSALLRVIARLPRGRVILTGLDRAMAETHFSTLGSAHPDHADAGIARLLTALGARRDDVQSLPGLPSAIPAERSPTLRRALLPAPALAWPKEAPAEIAGLFRLSPADQQEEATAAALALRAALETPGQRAALVTPDRALARRVSAELLRYGIVADDSAGEPLGETPPAVLLRLLAAAAEQDYAALPLLAQLKHPLCAAGLAPPAARAAARRLELAVLRGPGPPPGLAALAQAAERKGDGLDLVRRLRTALSPLERVRTLQEAAPGALLAALIESAERLAATETEPGPARLWALEEGEALASRLAELLPALAHLPPIPPAELSGLLTESLAGAVVRTRRSLRGREGTEHPRVFIWGLLEARLQSAEVIVLGGLTEGTWPPATDPGPWLSRPMRAALGLDSPEEAIGRAAHDFLSATLAAPIVILSAPRRREGAPAVPARWLVRLEAMLAGQDRTLPEHPSLAWARALDHPAGPAKPARAPRPRPALALRPRQLGLTEIATWLADPYQIYARHVLGLTALPAIGQVADAAQFGMIVHQGLAAFFGQAGGQAGKDWEGDEERHIAAALAQALKNERLPAHLVAWWAPRLPRIAAWVAAAEAERRREGPPVAVAVEQPGDWSLNGPAGPFLVRGRADRIELRADGHLAILDYKTGRSPGRGAVAAGQAPQLPLLAAMAAAGAFGTAFARPATELVYWALSGRMVPGEATSLGDPAEIAELVAAASAGLAALIARFDDPATPYLARPHPANLPDYSDYDRLARVGEWAAAEE